MKTKNIVLLGLFIALVAVATMVIRIPVPGTEGYINIGDSVIFALSFLFGPFAGLAAGGVGSGLADLLSGYPHWAIPTMVIKGLEGYIVAKIGWQSFSAGGHRNVRFWLALLAGAVFMVTGYWAASAVMYGPAAAIASVPSNVVQGCGSMIVAVPLVLALKKALGKKI
jgi:uncharacterized membrane protein